MTARRLDGTAIAAAIKEDVAREVTALAAQGIKPGLAAVLVGHVPASEIYVRSKVRTCQELGLGSELLTPPETVTTEEMLALVTELNGRDDVDGFHPVNVGRLQTGQPALAPCTPAGLIEILKRSNLPIAGQNAVVIGRSDIVGKPAAILLLAENATVTICHSKTRDLPGVCRTADIVVAAIGRPGYVTRDMVKPGATLLDVGINRLSTRDEFDRFFHGNRRREEMFIAKGSTLIGDVHPAAYEISGAYTPVPGGVGPLTIAMLMANTVRAAKLRRGLL